VNKDLLLEIFSEDLPAAASLSAISQLKQNASDLLDSYGLHYDQLFAYGTPRRLILHVQGLQEQQPDRKMRRTGPSKSAAVDQQGHFTQAALGFAKSAGLAPDQLRFINSEKGEVLCAEWEVRGKKTVEILPAFFDELFRRFHFVKTMYWDETKTQFPRPLRGLLAFWGDDPLEYTYAGLKSSSVTFGHRFLSGNRRLEVKGITDYFKKLAENHVMYDPAERERVIIEEGQKVLPQGLKARFDRELLDVVVHLVEYPIPQVCSFDKKFLALPTAISLLEMKSHQKYFPVFDSSGKLSEKFLVILNNRPSQYTQEGNQRVVTARLKDAEFFITEDLKVKSLEDYNAGLAKVLQHKEIGNLADRLERICKLTDVIVAQLNVQNPSSIKRTALLCKADLLSKAVFEFTELQGVIGAEYARRLGEAPEVAKGIEEHYKPLSAEDSIPEGLEGCVVGLADKIDSICAGFSAGLKPTSSKDPYQLRRAAFGVIKILVGKQLELDLKVVLKAAIANLKRNDPSILPEIIDFFKGRMETVLADRGITYDEIDAVLSADFSNISLAFLKISALHVNREKEDFVRLIASLKRMSHILKDVKSFKPIDPDLFVEKEEKVLFKAYQEKKDSCVALIGQRQFAEVFALLASFKPAVDSFFDKVMVMTDEIPLRENRLSLLHEISSLFRQVLDFDKLTIK
jgi:glycyl-tRNA synthetase beta chain